MRNDSNLSSKELQLLEMMLQEDCPLTNDITNRYHLCRNGDVMIQKRFKPLWLSRLTNNVDYLSFLNIAKAIKEALLKSSKIPDQNKKPLDEYLIHGFRTGDHGLLVRRLFQVALGLNDGNRNNGKGNNQKENNHENNNNQKDKTGNQKGHVPLKNARYDNDTQNVQCYGIPAGTGRSHGKDVQIVLLVPQEDQSENYYQYEQFDNRSINVRDKKEAIGFRFDVEKIK